MLISRSRLLTSFALIGMAICSLACPVKSSVAQNPPQTASAEPKLTEEEMTQFLLNAKVIDSRQEGKGVTKPFILTLSDGKITHDASFQSIDEYKDIMDWGDGTVELGFRDTYHYNLAAYELAKLIGLQDRLPVTVERKWRGKKGSLTWWIDDIKMDEDDRSSKGITPPDAAAWEKDIQTMSIFKELICESNRNRTNLLYDSKWRMYMVDFGRAFRRNRDINTQDLYRCSRQMFERLRQLTEADLERATKPHLQKRDVKAVIARRDKIVAHYEKLIAQKGEREVLH